MNKDFVNANALLQVEGFEVTDGKVTLTASQLAAIENALKDSANAEKALDDVSPKVKEITGLQNKVKALTIMLDNAPVAPAIVRKPDDKTSNEVTVENGDAITEEARTSIRRNKK